MLFVRIELLNRIYACHMILNGIRLSSLFQSYCSGLKCYVYAGCGVCRAKHFLLAHSGGPHLPPVRLTVPGLSKALCARLSVAVAPGLLPSSGPRWISVLPLFYSIQFLLAAIDPGVIVVSTM